MAQEENRMSKRYTVQQLGRLSGVSVRTLHHYDRIGLLIPATVGENGYRYYGTAELLRLQQILLHREFGLSLSDIASVIDQQAADRIGHLRAQQVKLQAEAARYRLLSETIEHTINSLANMEEHGMEHIDLYKGFSAEKQLTYESEVTQAFGSQSVESSIAARNGMSPLQSQAMRDELAEIELAIASLLRQRIAADDKVLAPLIERHRSWVASMWGRPCPPEAHRLLSDMYSTHPDFRARYESIATGMTDYFSSAIKFHST